MVKGKPSYPFETIALAVAFSPRLEALIAETQKLAQSHAARVLFIHVGKKTSDKHRLLSGLLVQYGFSDANSKVVWEQGDPVETILSVCKREVADLIIIGALEKGNMTKYFMGSISREISRKAKCSVLMLTRPRLQPVPFKKILVNGHDHPKTYNTIRTATYFAEKENIPEIILIQEMNTPESSVTLAEESNGNKLQGLDEPVSMMEKSSITRLAIESESSSVKIKTDVLSGRYGNGLGHFAQEQMADLLVVNSPEHHLSIFDRIFSHDLEYMLSDMPCNLLVVHTRFSA